jgi:hypothetical protein
MDGFYVEAKIAFLMPADFLLRGSAALKTKVYQTGRHNVTIKLRSGSRSRARDRSRHQVKVTEISQSK